MTADLIAKRLRHHAATLRTNSLPLSDLIPLLCQAADALDTQSPAEGDLTDEQIVALLEAAGIKFQRFMGGIGGVEDLWSTAGCQDVRQLAAGVRAIVAASKVRPAWAPMQYLVRARWPDGIEEYLHVRGVYDLGGKMGIDVDAPQGHPLDEQAPDFKAQPKGMCRVRAASQPCDCPVATCNLWRGGLRPADAAEKLRAAHDESLDDKHQSCRSMRSTA